VVWDEREGGRETDCDYDACREGSGNTLLRRDGEKVKGNSGPLDGGGNNYDHYPRIFKRS
jgi:hypothetical protein